MRSGADWVQTDYYDNQSQCFEFTAARVSNTRKVKITWWMTTYSSDKAASPTYYLCWGNQKLVVNGSVQVNLTKPSYSNNPQYTDKNTGNTVYYGFADKDSWLDNNYRNSVFFDIDGDYLGIQRYLKVLGTKWTGSSFELTADDAGTVSFDVDGKFGWDGKTGLNFYKKFTISNKVPPATYSIKFNENKSNFVGTNTISSMPSTITKTYNTDIKLPALPIAKDSKGNITYRAVAWSLDPKDSFASRGKLYSANTSISNNSALTFYAIWEKEKKTVTYDVGDGQFLSNTAKSVATYYGAEITLPSADMVSRYGSALKGWKDSNGNFFAQGSTYTVYGDMTLTAVYGGSDYNITLCDINGNILRTLQNQYQAPLYGNFEYSVPGYTCAGWTTNANVKKYDATQTLPPIVDNLNIISSVNVLNDYMYIGCGNYTVTNPFILPDVGVDNKNIRLHIIGQDIKLYPILVYETSFYVYHNNTWKLAMPYVYHSNAWKQSAGYVYKDNAWKR